jgi:hypothetical protein
MSGVSAVSSAMGAGGLEKWIAVAQSGHSNQAPLEGRGIVFMAWQVGQQISTIMVQPSLLALKAKYGDGGTRIQSNLH